MAVKIEHTHYLDRVMRVFVFLLTLIIPFAMMYVIVSALNALGITPPEWTGWILLIVLFIAVVVVRNDKLMYAGGPFDAFSAFLYIRLGLGVKVSLSEANRVSSLFVPNHTGTWWPMKGLKKTPKEYRKDEFAHATQDIINKYFDLHFKFYEFN